MWTVQCVDKAYNLVLSFGGERGAAQRSLFGALASPTRLGAARIASPRAATSPNASAQRCRCLSRLTVDASSAALRALAACVRTLLGPQHAPAAHASETEPALLTSDALAVLSALDVEASAEPCCSRRAKGSTRRTAAA